MSAEIAVPPATEATQPQPSRARRLAAWALALTADAVQIALLPLFGEGAASPATMVIDVVVAGALTYLVGFHWSFVPTLMIEALPIADLAPTWTGAVFLATRARKS